MKNVKFFLILFFSFSLIAGLQAQSVDPIYNTDDSKIALQGYSPVSYIDLNLAQRGLKAYKSEYQGLNYYFTSAEQKAKFDANPEKYLPQYGGWCATGIAVGSRFRTDPNKFLITDGKLYVFLNNVEVDALELWLQDKEGMRAKADKNWKKMQ